MDKRRMTSSGSSIPVNNLGMGSPPFMSGANEGLPHQPRTIGSGWIMFYSRSTLSRLWQHLFGSGNCDELTRNASNEGVAFSLKIKRLCQHFPHAEVRV